MKKSLFIITCFCSIITISCASKKTPENKEVFENPEIDLQNDETTPSDYENQTDNQSESNENLNITENSEILSDDFESQNSPQMEIIGQEEIILETKSNNEDDILLENDLPEIEEPEIITLEPEPENKLENPENQTEQTELDDSILEVDVTDIEIQDDNQSGTEENSDNVQDENQQEEDDDIVLVIESENSTIDITNDENTETLEEEISANPEDKTESVEKIIIPSRKVTLKRMEYLDISYPGRGWIYMGITDGSKDLSYFGRKLGTSDTNFTFQAKIEGTKILHFTKNDALKNEYIEDYIEVEILSEKGSNKTHVKAPEFKQQSKNNQNQSVKDDFSQEIEQNVQKQEAPSVSDEKKQTENKSAGISNAESTLDNQKNDKTTQINTVEKTGDAETNSNQTAELASNPTSTSNSTSNSNIIEEKEDFDPKTLLKEAKLLYNEKEYKFALEKIETVLEKSDIGNDEALYLQGQCYEAKSEIQNIKKALNSYTLLLEKYPASKYWDNANKRIIYLKRFYLEAR